MNFELAEKLSQLVKLDKLQEAISLAEGELSKTDTTGFHIIRGRNLLHLSEHLIKYLETFYNQVKENITVKTIYCEMNGFALNPDLWFLDGFAYDHYGGDEDYDWLADWESNNTTEESIVITGFEDLQKIYANYMTEEKWIDERQRSASNVCELLIVLRLLELFKDAGKKARARHLKFVEATLLVTAHDYYDFIYKV